MYQYFGSLNQTASIELGKAQRTDAPRTVTFTRDGVQLAQVDAEAFQILRRGVVRESTNPDSENKINLIKAVRGLTRLGLREAKEVVEYFLENYDINCDNRTGR